MKTIILGSGFTGLLTASKIPGAIVISENIGGLIRSNEKNGFSFDFGGHVYTPSDDNVNDLMHDIGATYHPQRKAYYDVQKYIPYPVQDHAHELGLTISPIHDGREDGTLLDFFFNKFGENFTNEFLVPFNERVWSTDPAKMSDDWVNGRVKKPRESAKAWGMNSSFWYAKGQSIIQYLQFKAAKNDAIFVDGQVIDINKIDRIVKVRRGRVVDSFKYDALIDTTGMFMNERTNEVLSIGIGLRKLFEGKPFHWIYPNLESSVHRVTLLSRYAKNMAPTGSDSFLLEVPYIHTSGLPVWAKHLLMYGNHTSVKLRTAAVDGLLNAGFTNEQVNSMSISTVWASVSRGYPVQTVGCRGRVSERKFVLAKNRIFSIGRWGSHLYANLQHLYQDVDSLLKFGQDPSSEEAQRNYFDSEFYYGG